MPSPQDILQFFIDFFGSGWFKALQIASGIISFILFAASFWLIKKAGYPQRHIRHLLIAWRKGELPGNKYSMVLRWNKVEEGLNKDNPAVWRLSICDADQMLNEVLIKVGYKGDSIDERLQNVNTVQFPTLAEAWRAHQVCKFIEEDLNYLPTREVAEKTIEIYRNIFKETGIIL